MKCKFCNSEIEDNSKYCNYCGEKVTIEANDYNLEEKTRDEDVLHNNLSFIKPRPLFDNSKGANTSLILGIVATVAGFFGFFMGLILGIIGFILGIKNYSEETKKKALWGIVFGFLGVFLTVILLAYTLNNTIYASTADNVFSKELNIQIPDKEPIEYYKNSTIDVRYEYNVNYLIYELDNVELTDLINQISSDDRWNTYNVSWNFKNQFKDLDINYNSYYLCYNRKTNTFEFPENLNEYNFVVVVVDELNSYIAVYEVWNNQEE